MISEGAPGVRAINLPTPCRRHPSRRANSELSLHSTDALLSPGALQANRLVDPICLRRIPAAATTREDDGAGQGREGAKG
jgi:hypothetical protein